MRSATDDKRIKATQEYFRLADEGRAQVLDYGPLLDGLPSGL